MEIIFCTVPLVIFMLVWLAAPYVVSGWQRESAGKVWEGVGQAKGLTFEHVKDEGKIKLTGEINGHKIELVARTVISGGFDSPFRNIQFRLPTWSFITDLAVGLKKKAIPDLLRLDPHSMLREAALAAISVVADHKNAYEKTGDDAFDKRFYIDAMDHDFAENALSDSSIRNRLIDLRRKASVVFTKNFNTIDYSCEGLERDEQYLTELINLLVAWADHIDMTSK